MIGADLRTGPDARTRLTENLAELRRLEALAAAATADGDIDGALRATSTAAAWAWHHHTGTFASERLERLAAQLGLLALRGHPTMPAPATGPTPEAGTDRLRVLHVLTQAYEIGGHTRLTWRWMDLDPNARHTVLLTAQGDVPVPEALRTAAVGRLIELRADSPSERVRQIAALAGGFDLIIWNAHPDDAVSLAALSAMPDRPRTVLLNCADHVFWLGLGAADQIAELRPSGGELTRTRRVGSSSRSVRLPLPLPTRERDADGAAALRAALEIGPDAPVAMTMAEVYKYGTSDEPVFVSLVAELLATAEELHLLAVGPDQRAPGFATLSERFPRRVHLLGRTAAYASALDTASIYLDSYPFSSITATLEAAAAGLPVLSLANPAVGLLGFDDDGLEPERASSGADWLAIALRWLAEPELARTRGAEMRDAALSVHAPDAWRASLRALRRGPWHRRELEVVADHPISTDADVAILRLAEAARGA
jgi:hypothetical protein